ncbi:MAG: ABC transporter ATP-binding protein [Desulfococcus multivorans]|jgi:iron complex transport system ATP-binding protein|nr:ABC transporter ATP-binding protein [Desulfococcus multivorans]
MAFQADGISFAYGDRPVLKSLSLDLEPGCFYGVLGPNGCGKSTLIDILMGLHKPQAGRIRYKGRDLSAYRKRELARELALVPQNFYINFPFTALDVVMMGRYPHMPRFAPPSVRDLSVVTEIMERTDTLPFRHRYMTEMSGGERQRVIFARALVQETPVLMLDEATSNLDIRHTLTLMDLVADEVRHHRKLVVAVIQDINLAAGYCDRLILMKDGRIVDFGNTETVLTRENIQQVFGVWSHIHEDPYTRKLRVSFERKAAP